MTYKIPRDPEWCSSCRDDREECPFHGAERRQYEGPDAYEPSPWVLSVVGGRYSSVLGPVLCVGYDPRHGFWVRDDDGRERNVSEGAIGRSLHRVDP